MQKSDKWKLVLYTRGINQELLFKNKLLAADCIKQMLAKALEHKEDTNKILAFEDDFGSVFAFPAGNLVGYKIEKVSENDKVDRIRDLQIEYYLLENRKLREQLEANEWKEDRD